MASVHSCICTIDPNLISAKTLKLSRTKFNHKPSFSYDMLLGLTVRIYDIINIVYRLGENGDEIKKVILAHFHVLSFCLVFIYII